MALPNNPTPAELVKAVKDLEQGGGGSSTDVQVDSTSITSGGVADLKTKNGDYNASTNKLVTENDLPLPSGFKAFGFILAYTGSTVVTPTSIPRNACSFSQATDGLSIGDHILVFREEVGDSTVKYHTFDFTISNISSSYAYTGTATQINGMINTFARAYASLTHTNTFTGSNTFTNLLKLTGGISDNNNSTYKLDLPDTTSWTADKTIATTDDVATKQDIISDLATIRSGASAGATAVQPSDISDVVVHDDTVTTATETTFADNYYTKTQCDNRYLLQSNEFNWTNLVTLYSTSSVSTGTKTLSDSLANYKLLLIGQYTTNSGGWTFQTIPRVLFDTMTSSSTGLWVTQYSGSNRRIYIYKVSNTQIYLYNVDGSDKVAIYGLK